MQRDSHPAATPASVRRDKLTAGAKSVRRGSDEEGEQAEDSSQRAKKTRDGERVFIFLLTYNVGV